MPIREKNRSPILSELCSRRGLAIVRLRASNRELLAALDGMADDLEPYARDETDLDIRARLFGWIEGARAAIANAKITMTATAPPTRADARLSIKGTGKD